ncbi:MAG: hypothetical protein RIA63_03705, partial [Cyclobacteriaceae bacterium]
MRLTNLSFWFVIIISILVRFEHEVNMFDFALDKSWQLEATANFLNGNGISICKTDPGNFEAIECKRQVNWPFGYSVCLTLINRIIDDLIVSSILLDILGISLFYFALLRLLELLEIGKTGRVVGVLMYTFASFPLYFIASSDLLALAIFTFVLYLFLSKSESAEIDNTRLS